MKKDSKALKKSSLAFSLLLLSVVPFPVLLDLGQI